MLTPTETAALDRAAALAARGRATVFPNPPVGCVVLDSAGALAGSGWHRQAGTEHAEILALAEAGDRARGGTAIVTLEPCRHHGRTPPCHSALLEAGVARVIYAVADPTAVAGGGGAALAEAGVSVVGPVDHDPTRRLLEPWLTVQRTGRPYVHLKLATSVDGRVAAADGTSRWISGESSRHEAHALRADCDAVLVGTATVIADDPELTVRHVASQRQPLRVALGIRDLPADAKIFNSDAPTLHLRTHDVKSALADLIDRGVGSVLVEGGPIVAGAFLAAGAVDRITVFAAPLVLGAGSQAVADAGVSTLPDGIRFDIDDVHRSGEDVVISGLVRRAD